MYTDVRRTWTEASPETAFAVQARLGGDAGWLGVGPLWQVRGALDRAVGGVGYRRSHPRREPPGTPILAGDTVDFWRVEAAEPGRKVSYRAEMKLPGVARLSYRFEAFGDTSRITQVGTFHPRGALGRAYWWVMYPAHRLVFARMLRALAERAEAVERGVAELPGTPPM